MGEAARAARFAARGDRTEQLPASHPMDVPRTGVSALPRARVG